VDLLEFLDPRGEELPLFQNELERAGEAGDDQRGIRSRYDDGLFRRVR
jgi:hypothetical protein